MDPSIMDVQYKNPTSNDKDSGVNLDSNGSLQVPQSQSPFVMELAAVPVMTYDAYGNSSIYYMASPLLSGYQNYTTTTGNPAVAAAQAAAARFPGQPALAATANVPGASGYHTTTAPLPGSVSVSPSALTGTTSSPGSTAQLPAGGHYTSPQQATNNPYRGPSPGFKSHQYQSFQSASSPPGRGYKRKNDDCASDSGDSKQDSTSRHSTNGQNEHYKLYCKVCRVTLNAPAQAKQHYEGKSHAKRAKLHDDGDENKKTTESSSSSSSTPQNGTATSPSLKPSIKQESNPSSTSSTTCTTSNSTSTSSTISSTDSSTSTSNSTTTSASAATTVTTTSSTTTTTADIHPDVYCKTCGVSFNSTKQAHQHYEGKNHKKKLRASLKANRYDKKAAMAGSKYSCNICRKVMTSQEQLNVHLKGAWHAMQVKTMEKSTAKALRGAWASWTHPKHSGEYMNGMLKPLGFATAAGSLGSPLPLQPANLNPAAAATTLLKLRPTHPAAAPGLTTQLCTLNGQLNGLTAANGLTNGLTNGLNAGGLTGWTTLPQL